ncbi:type II toxin-antitoxin system Phd/YefM family antitoxin [Nitratidesulfovibrio termitidis]|uniref:type II toxin-antitoxin system Phd/YefM family antitoxin n=1 Tax=Nitratidesulfovibrio termitidis TaxID=42252 RepID=UPI0003F76DB8|nr:type II toxin-antitoxin system Phd/YefM family antitoxin [Nitratidesulfovibrio termitidis]
MRLSEDIKSISYVKANTGKVLEKVNTSGPMIITQNGEASAVLMGVKDYDLLTEGIALLKILSMGEKSLQEGYGVSVNDAFAHIRARIREAKANG